MIKLLYRLIPVIGFLVCMFGNPISADAANFQMKTGYYMGSGVTGLTISNIGFQPQLLIIKSNVSGAAVFKTSEMPENTTAYMTNILNNTQTQITFTSTGFSVGTISSVNTVNVIYSYIAFAGSDCTVTGTFCVGQYIGNRTDTRDINTGFQPSLVMVQRSNTATLTFRTASMPVNHNNFFGPFFADTSGNYIKDFTNTSFIVGRNNNFTDIYYYIAFSTTAGIMAEGTYTGDGLDNRNIVTNLGFEPNMVLVKNSNSNSTNFNSLRPVMNITQNYGDNSSYIDGSSNSVNLIQELQSNGFQIGSGENVNENTRTFYWFAFGGAADPPAGSGTFTMKTGTYIGTGANQSITGLGFKPDLVIIKDNTTQVAVFRTSMMFGDITAHMSNFATIDFTSGITSFTDTGFNLGTSSFTNRNGLTYQYQAFGNAYNPYTNSGANDFAIGVYYGNGIDNRDIKELPFNPGLIAIKGTSSTAATFRVSANTGDQSNYFGATAQAANLIQSFTGNNFQVGTGGEVNREGSNYRFFAFAEGTNFDVGTYTGNGLDNRDITLPTFDVALLWIKRSTAIAAVFRPNTLVGDLTQYFTATANAAGRIKSFITNGFRLGTQTEVNANTGVYYYAAWRDRNPGALSINIVDTGGTTIASPTVSFPSIDRKISCQNNSSVLGVSNAKIRVTNGTINPQWNLTIAATRGATANWNNGAGANYDFNDPNNSGCGDGADADSFAGQLSINPSIGTSTPSFGCNNNGLSFGSSSAFNQGIVDSITILTAGSTAGVSGCYWDITGIGMDQTIPQEQSNGTYSIDFTISAIAF